MNSSVCAPLEQAIVDRQHWNEMDDVEGIKFARKNEPISRVEPSFIQKLGSVKRRRKATGLPANLVLRIYGDFYDG
ncbi:MAG: hypothetical protein OXG05_11990 [Gammaproteobacteria bacterium]|nr:hypothetical protein [Gammaproteobacteria bacterium]